MGNRNTVVDKTQQDKFTLELPAELASIQPRWEIALPRKHKARVFETTYTRKVRLSADEVVTEPRAVGLKLQITNSRGREHPYYSTNNVYDAADGLLDLKLAIEAVVVALTPKTKTRVSRDEYIDDDED
jgi:hypothetical protein